LGLWEADKLIAAATFIFRPLVGPYKYLYCPRGPIVKNRVDLINLSERLFTFIKDSCRSVKVVFVRFDPALKDGNLKQFATSTIPIQPAQTILVNLAQAEEKILESMHQKTRYNIRLAQKKGVAIKEGSPDEFEKFWELLSLTGERDAFRLHSKNYYEKMIIENSSIFKLFFAEYNQQIIATALVSFFGDTATYLHGASSNQDRNVKAPHLLQWSLIQKAKERGYKYYDFFGIDELKWPGVTRFKKGFGGEIKNYSGTYDFIVNKPIYSLYKLARKMRRSL
jgi:lipid II:glycine glycyltransferase (peptidoglycan interpeptide bridge formation enzyme)